MQSNFPAQAGPPRAHYLGSHDSKDTFELQELSEKNKRNCRKQHFMVSFKEK